MNTLFGSASIERRQVGVLGSFTAFAQGLNTDKALRSAMNKVDLAPVRSAGIALADALNTYRALALEEEALIRTKKILRGLRPLREPEYLVTLNRFKDKLPDAIDAVRSGLDQFESSGLNLVLTRHVLALIEDGKLHPRQAWAEAEPHLGDSRFSVLTELFGLNPEVTEHVWGTLADLPVDLAVTIYDLEDLKHLDPGLGTGLSNLGGGGGSGGIVAHINATKGMDLLVQDFMYLWDVFTTNYSEFVATNGLPVAGDMLAFSPSHLAASSSVAGFVVGCLLLIAGGILGFATLGGAVLGFIGAYLIFTNADAVGDVGASGFVDP